MSNSLIDGNGPTPLSDKVRVKKCEFCGHFFPVVEATFIGPGGKEITAHCPVVPAGVQVFKRKQNILGLGGRPMGISAQQPPALEDPLEGIFVLVPHELVCEKRSQAIDGQCAPLHNHLIVSPVPGAEEGEEN